MESQGVVERSEEWRRDAADELPHSLDRNRSNLFRLSLRVPAEPALLAGEEDLKWIDPLHVRSDGHDGHNPPAQTLRCCIGTVVADDDRGPTLAGL